MPSIRPPHVIPQSWDWEVCDHMPVAVLQKNPETGEVSQGLAEGEPGVALTISDASGFKTMFLNFGAAEAFLEAGTKALEEGKSNSGKGIIVANGKVDEKEAQEFISKNKRLRGVD